MAKIAILTEEQATALAKLTIHFAQLSEEDRQHILEASPMYKEILTKGKVDYINNKFILTITD